MKPSLFDGGADRCCHDIFSSSPLLASGARWRLPPLNKRHAVQWRPDPPQGPLLALRPAVAPVEPAPATPPTTLPHSPRPWLAERGRAGLAESSGRAAASPFHFISPPPPSLHHPSIIPPSSPCQWSSSPLSSSLRGAQSAVAEQMASLCFFPPSSLTL